MEKTELEQKNTLLKEANELTREDRPYKKEDLDRLKDINFLLQNVYVDHRAKPLGK